MSKPNSPELILASASQARRALLEKASIAFSIVAADIDEDYLKAKMNEQGVKPEAFSIELALSKARAISQQYPDKVILGADQLLICQDRSFDKAKNLQEAEQHLRFLRGKTHHLYTSYALMKNQEIIVAETICPSLTMRNFSDIFLENYLQKSGSIILNSVGCYMLEDLGSQLFSEIKGDYFAILGLPLLNVMENLRKLNILKS